MWEKNVLFLAAVIEHNEAHFQKSVTFGLLDWNCFLDWLPTIGKDIPILFAWEFYVRFWRKYSDLYDF